MSPPSSRGEDKSAPEGSVPGGTSARFDGDQRWDITLIVKLTSDVGSMTADLRRLGEDVRGMAEKLDNVRHTLTFVRGAIWVIGGVMAIIVVAAGWYFSGRLNITFTPPK